MASSMICRICGYAYKPEIGDPDGEILPGTSFKELPDSWVCPICGAAKEFFRESDGEDYF